MWLSESFHVPLNERLLRRDVMPAEAGTHDTGPSRCGELHGSSPTQE